jgi:hypothetical protein
VNDDSSAGYAVGAFWVNTASDTTFVCSDVTVGAAVWTNITAGAGGGETNTASNSGVGGVGVWVRKTGVDLEFKNINAGSSKITVADDAGNDEIDIDATEANFTLDNIGGTLGIAKGGTGQTAQTAAFDALSPGTTKGDVIVHNGSDNVRVAVGSNTQILVADSADAEGLKWAAREPSKSITVEDPTSSEDISVFFTNKAITISEIRAVLVGSASPSVTWTIRHGTDRSAAGAEVVTGGTTTTSISTGSDVTVFNDATIVADSFVWLETTAQSGTVDELHITIVYTEDV